MPDRFDPATGPSRSRAIVLPGVGYSPAAPLLDFGAQVLLQRGWTVQQVWWDLPSSLDQSQTGDWVRKQFLTAWDAETQNPLELDRLVVMAKSLGTLAAPAAPVPAIWLTPLLTSPGCADAIRANVDRGIPQLLVGGTADRVWDGEAARSTGARYLEIADANHGLCVPNDAVRSAEIHVEVTRAIDDFLTNLNGAADDPP